MSFWVIGQTGLGEGTVRMVLLPQSPVLCVTLNPSWEIIHEAPQWRRSELVRAARSWLVPGGKGVNVARALQALGVPALCTGLLGREGHACLVERLGQEGLHGRWFLVGGAARVNVTIFDPQPQSELHAIGLGPYVRPDQWAGFCALFVELLSQSGLVVIAGSAPRGVSPDEVAQLVHLARERDRPTIVDASGTLLRRLLAAVPNGVKVNRQELAEALGADVDQHPEKLLREAARRYLEAPGSWLVMTDGERPAWAIAGGRVASVAPPRVRVVQTVGSGDAFLAGLIWALRRECSLFEALRYGAAAGAAACTGPVPAQISEKQLISLLTR